MRTALASHFAFLFGFILFASSQNITANSKTYCSSVSSTTCDSLVASLVSRASYSKGDYAVVYLTAVANYTLANNNTIPYTSQFFLKVDDYSSINVPGCMIFLIQATQMILSSNPYVYVSVLYNNAILQLDPLPWYDFNQQQGVPSRSIVITLDKGVFVNVAWEKTSCVKPLAPACYCIADVCARICDLDNPCDFKVNLIVIHRFMLVGLELMKMEQY